MPIKQWHVGKLILLTAWGIILIAVLLQLLRATHHFVSGFLIIGILAAIPIVLSVILWICLTGKEQH